MDPTDIGVKEWVTSSRRGDLARRRLLLTYDVRGIFGDTQQRSKVIMNRQLSRHKAASSRQIPRERRSPGARFFPFLKRLRAGGRSNMYGAIPYLMRTFGLDREAAFRVVCEWEDAQAIEHAEG
jgi:hypothetical protein